MDFDKKIEFVNWFMALERGLFKLGKHKFIKPKKGVIHNSEKVVISEDGDVFPYMGLFNEWKWLKEKGKI